MFKKMFKKHISGHSYKDNSQTFCPLSPTLEQQKFSVIETL